MAGPFIVTDLAVADGCESAVVVQAGREAKGSLESVAQWSILGLEAHPIGIHGLLLPVKEGETVRVGVQTGKNAPKLRGASECAVTWAGFRPSGRAASPGTPETRPPGMPASAPPASHPATPHPSPPATLPSGID